MSVNPRVLTVTVNLTEIALFRLDTQWGFLTLHL
jgi:hypothetical protein